MKRRPETRSNFSGDRPEKSKKAELHYDDREAERYTTVGTAIGVQKDLTLRAMALLKAHQPQVSVLLDLGCGSGLSSVPDSPLAHGNENLSPGKPVSSAWIGADISPSMLHLASQQRECCGRIVLSDMAQGVCLRPGCLDGAISISALQWLCVHQTPQKAMDTLFSSLWRSLCNGCGAVFQVYLENDEQGELLLVSAQRNGFHAGLFIDFPHVNSSKKQFLCCKREDKFSKETTTCIRNLSSRPCNLAWPTGGCCMLGWMYGCGLNHASRSRSSPEIVKGEARLRQEHAQMGKKALRLLRRCCNKSSETEHNSTSVEFGGNAPNRELVPCGGPLAFRLSFPNTNQSLENSINASTRAIIELACGTHASDDLHFFYNSTVQTNGNLKSWSEFLDPLNVSLLKECQTPYYGIQAYTPTEVTKTRLLEKYSPRFAIMYAERHPLYLVVALEIASHSEFPNMREDMCRFCTECRACAVGMDVVMEQIETSESNVGVKSSCAWILYIKDLKDLLGSERVI
jgi:18S rRNA (guanine1575-N7)-methyltransferase